jgi:hypothetical protein
LALAQVVQVVVEAVDQAVISPITMEVMGVLVVLRKQRVEVVLLVYGKMAMTVRQV